MTKQAIPLLDLMFFLTETPLSPKHVGALQIFQLPRNAPKNYLQNLVAAFKKAPIVAPFNRRPHFPRFGMPEWRDDTEIEINYHVRHSALPSPGNTRQLMDVVERLHAGLLDRRRPCWTCQVIEGLEGNRFAVYSKVHHAYIDGMSGVKRMYGSLSTSAKDKKIVPSWSFDSIGAGNSTRPRGKSGNRPATGKKVAAQLKGVMGAYEVLSKMGLQKLKLRHSEAQVPFTASRTLTNRSIKWDSRAVSVCTLPLDKVKAVAKNRSCTINEVVLALIGTALDDYLEKHHEKASAPLVALCPMSIREKGDDSASTQVSAVHVRLGEPGAAIAERLNQVIESSHASKDEIKGVSPEAMIDFGVIIFGLWEILARTGLDQVIAPSYNVLVSNVPGPGNEKLYLCGSQMLASYPISTLMPGVNINITLLSHGNALDFGLLGDRHALPDIDFVAERMNFHFSRLEKKLPGNRKQGGK